MTTLGWTCHTRAAPSSDMFNLGSSYFHVALTTVRHLLTVGRWDWCSLADNNNYSAMPCVDILIQSSHFPAPVVYVDNVPSPNLTLTYHQLFMGRGYCYDAAMCQTWVTVSGSNAENNPNPNPNHLCLTGYSVVTIATQLLMLTMSHHQVCVCVCRHRQRKMCQIAATTLCDLVSSSTRLYLSWFHLYIHVKLDEYYKQNIHGL